MGVFARLLVVHRCSGHRPLHPRRDSLKTRTALMLVIALLVVAALPASATDDSQSDVCNGLLNALDVLENHSQASQRAIDNVTARAEAADCLDTRFAASRKLCDSVGGTFTAGEGESVWGGTLLWMCADWTYANAEELDLIARLLQAPLCRSDGGNYVHVSDETLGTVPGYPQTTECVYRLTQP